MAGVEVLSAKWNVPLHWLAGAPRHIHEGWIRIRRTKHDPKRFSGDTLFDCELLRSYYGWPYFDESEYDAVLHSVGEHFGIEYLEDSKEAGDGG